MTFAREASFPVRGETPAEQRTLTSLRDMARAITNSGSFLQRPSLGSLLRRDPAKPTVSLKWGDLNRAALTVDTAVSLPPIEPKWIGVPLYFAKLTATGRALVIPSGRAAATKQVPLIDGSALRTCVTPGLYIFVTDGSNWSMTGSDSRRLFDVTLFGASPAASAARNDAAFQAASDAASAAGGGTVYVPAGTYLKLAQTTLGSGVTLEGEGDASVLDYSGVTGTLIGLMAAGTQAAGVALSANATEGTDDLNVLGTGFATGDWVKVYSSAVTGSTNVPKGEICRVNDAATMTLFDPLCDTYNTADTASVALLALVDGVAFKNFKIVGPADNTVTFSGILADRTRGARFENITTERCHFYGIAIQDSIDWSVTGGSHGKSETGALAYGVAIFNASQDGTISCVRGYRLRHVVTHGGFTTRNGIPRRTVTSTCTASQARNSGFDVHAGAEDISFVNCTVLGSESDGFTLEGASVICSGCRVRDSVGPGFHLNPQSVKPFSATIDGCQVSGKGNAASRSGVQIQVRTGYELFDGITITGGVYTDCRYGLRTINAETGRVTNLTIAGVSYKQCGLDADAVIQVVHAQGVTVSGCTIDDSTNSVDGISLTDVIEFSVHGNVARLPGTGGCRGVRCLTTCVDGTIGGNTVDTGSSGIGIGLADTCTNITVASDNHLRGCPTALSFGTGAGHVYNQQPLMSADRGDADIVLTHDSEQVQRFNTALTSNADITLPGANVKMLFHVVREAGATGAFNVNIAALKSLAAASTWGVVQSDGTAYRLIASGAL